MAKYRTSDMMMKNHGNRRLYSRESCDHLLDMPLKKLEMETMKRDSDLRIMHVSRIVASEYSSVENRAVASWG